MGLQARLVDLRAYDLDGVGTAQGLRTVVSMEPSSPVVAYLLALRRTVRRRLLACGAFAVLAGGTAAFLTVLLLDWMLRLPPLLRLLGGALFVIGFAAAAVYWIAIPLHA